jgi:hypothetical protein
VRCPPCHLARRKSAFRSACACRQPRCGAPSQQGRQRRRRQCCPARRLRHSKFVLLALSPGFNAEGCWLGAPPAPRLLSHAHRSHGRFRHYCRCRARLARCRSNHDDGCGRKRHRRLTAKLRCRWVACRNCRRFGFVPSPVPPCSTKVQPQAWDSSQSWLKLRWAILAKCCAQETGMKPSIGVRAGSVKQPRRYKGRQSSCSSKVHQARSCADSALKSSTSRSTTKQPLEGLSSRS